MSGSLEVIVIVLTNSDQSLNRKQLLSCMLLQDSEGLVITFPAHHQKMIQYSSVFEI